MGGRSSPRELATLVLDAAEVIYPTAGMVLCNHKDFDYNKACFDAYNRWIAEFCGAHPTRLESPQERVRR